MVAAAGRLSKVWPELNCIMNLWCSAFNRMGLLCQCLCVRNSLSIKLVQRHGTPGALPAVALNVLVPPPKLQGRKTFCSVGSGKGVELMASESEKNQLIQVNGLKISCRQ